MRIPEEDTVFNISEEVESNGVAFHFSFVFFSCLLSDPPRDFSPVLGSSRLTGFFATSRVSRFVISCVPEVCLVRRRHRATNSRPSPKCACAGASFSRVRVSGSAVNYFVFILFFFVRLGFDRLSLSGGVAADPNLGSSRGYFRWCPSTRTLAPASRHVFLFNSICA